MIDLVLVFTIGFLLSMSGVFVRKNPLYSVTYLIPFFGLGAGLYLSRELLSWDSVSLVTYRLVGRLLQDMSELYLVGYLVLWSLGSKILISLMVGKKDSPLTTRPSLYRHFSTGGKSETYGPQFWGFKGAVLLDLLQQCCSMLKFGLWLTGCTLGMYLNPKYGWVFTIFLSCSFLAFTIAGIKRHTELTLRDIVLPMAFLTIPKAHALALSLFATTCSGAVGVLVYMHPASLAECLDLFAGPLGWFPMRYLFVQSCLWLFMGLAWREGI
jgi:hypothetical protein